MLSSIIIFFMDFLEIASFYFIVLGVLTADGFSIGDQMDISDGGVANHCCNGDA